MIFNFIIFFTCLFCIKLIEEKSKVFLVLSNRSVSLLLVKMKINKKFLYLLFFKLIDKKIIYQNKLRF